MTVKIDGVVINTRTDWRHTPAPAPVPQQFEGFPGVPENFVVAGVGRPGDLLIEGYLEGSGATRASAISTLIDAVEAQQALRADGQTHELTIYLRTYPACMLVDFACTGEVEAIDVGVGVCKVRRKCRWTWKRLTGAVATEAEEA